MHTSHSRLVSHSRSSREWPILTIRCASGVYGCAGKQLALLELRSALARIALNFDISFARGEDGIKFDKEAKDTFVLTLDALQLVFTERRK